MSERCLHTYCRRTPRALCKCCNQDLCLQHFWQHNDFVSSQLNTMKKEINEIDCRFKFLDISQSGTNFRQQLKGWRVDSYTVIDRFYERKCQEFNQYIRNNVENQRESLGRLQKRVDELIEAEYGNQQDVDLLRSNVNNLKRTVERVEQTPFPIILLPLVIDDNLIQIKK